MNQLTKGEIICIRNKYVINGVRHIIKYDPIIHTLLPGDIVTYTINPITSKIKITKLESRIPIKALGIVHGDKIIFPELPSIFFIQRTQFDQTLVYNQAQALVIQINLSSYELVGTYNPLGSTRLDDWKIALDLYKPIDLLVPVPILSTDPNQNPIYQDLTHLNTFNIDPPGSKDFDDAISFDTSANKIYTHIVDAHFQIEPGSQIDRDALAKTFTLYLSEHIENILPRELAEDGLSLIQSQPRKTVTVEYTLDPETFEVIDTKVYLAIIKIKTRYDYLSYDQLVSATVAVTEFVFMDKFISANSNKFSSLATPSLNLSIDKSTSLVKSWVCDYSHSPSPSHNLVQILMILTNQTISKLTDQIIPQRYHSFSLGSNLPIDKYTISQPINSVLSIKKFRKAIYSNTNSGHYGLGLSTYTHFTSPIRRYFDVIIHRLLQRCIYTNLDQVLEYINMREVHIDRVVKLYNKIKILSLFEIDLTKTWIGYIISMVPSKIILEDLLFEIDCYPLVLSQPLYSQVRIRVESIDWVWLKPRICLV